MAVNMLPPLPDVPEIHRRLLQIFPEGTRQRNYCTREMAARTVFVMLYIGAIEGSGMWMGPKHVYRMGAGQAALHADREREAYIAAVKRPGSQAPMDRWFQDNTREPIRDETLRDGLVRMGAVVVRRGLATTSSRGRYALQSAFASLFDPALVGAALDAAILAWQDRHLSAGALARIRLQQRSATAAQSRVLVKLPNGETRQMRPDLPRSSPRPWSRSLQLASCEILLCCGFQKAATRSSSATIGWRRPLA